MKQRIADVLADPNVRFGQAVAAGVVGVLTFVLVLYPAPTSILFVGAVLGSLNALIALGLVLVYRANRVINFAQGELGAIAGLLGVLLISSDRMAYLPAVIVGLAAALALGALVEVLLVRRFARAPRLILTVATIGIAQLLAAGEIGLPSLFGTTLAPQDFPLPFELTLTWDPVVLQGSHFLAIFVVVGVVVGLSAFFRRTRAGVAVRAAAESTERAGQLGIPVRRLGTLVWMLAAGLSALASLLRAPLVGLPIGQVLGPGLLLRALAAAVIGRMENLPLTFGAAVVLGMVEQAVLWHTGRAVITDAVLFFVIIGALLLQRRGVVARAVDAAVSTWDLLREVRPIPRELRRLPEVRIGFPALRMALAAGLVVAPAFLDTGKVNLLGTGLILAMVGASLVLLTGWAGEISLGQMALFGFGAAVAARLTEAGLAFLLVLLAAGVAGALVSAVIGVPALRIRGPFLAVTTFAFALATSSYFLNREFFGWLVIAGRVERPTLLGWIDLENETAYYYLLLVALGLVLASLRSVRGSRTGRVFVMVRDNARAAQSYGVSVVRTRLLAFALSGFFAALAGALFSFHQHVVGQSAFTPDRSLRIFSLVVFGGLGSLPGVLAGAAYFTALDYFVGLAQLRLLLSGAGLLLVLLIVPGGLGQLLYDARDRLLRAIAVRRGVVVPSMLADVDVSAPDAVPAPEPGAAAVLVARDLAVSYGRTQVLFGVDLTVDRGEIVALLGTNGAGKSTLLKAICGSITPHAGSVVLDGRDITRLRVEETAAAGVVIVPGGKGVFPMLTVRENLDLAAWLHADVDEERIFDLFPVLRDRLGQRAGDLSGGEQQMLTIAQALLARPQLLMIDELSLGLAPRLVEELLDAVRRIAADGTAVVLVEQSVNVALTVAERAVFMEKGAVVFAGPTADLLERPDVLRSVFLAGAAPGPRARPLRVRRGDAPIALEVDDLRVSFGGIPAVDGVDLTVRAGEVLGIIGPNGAGKTTLFDLLSGFVAPTGGTVRMGEVDITAWSPDERARAGLGRSFQDARLFPSLTVHETIAAACERHVASRDPIAALLAAPAVRRSERRVTERVDELVDLLRLGAYADKFVSELSTGTRRVVDLACCLAHEPSVLLLDEPSSGIAQREAEALAPLLLDIRSRTGAALLVIEHDIPLVSAVSDELLVLDLGRVLTRGVPEEVVHDPVVISSYLGSGVAVDRSGRSAP